MSRGTETRTERSHGRFTRSRRRAAVLVASAGVPLVMIGQASGASAAPANPATTQPLTAAAAAQLSVNANQHVIVILKGQFGAAPVGSAEAGVRASAIAAVQAPLMSELRQVHATHIKNYQPVDSLAATVSAGEKARLEANPAVAEVIPDVTIHGAQPEAAPAAA